MSDQKITKQNDNIIAYDAAARSLTAKSSARLGILKTYKLYIDGKFPRTESGRYYELNSPSGEVLANVSLASRKDFRDCVTAARGAFAKWSKASAYNRGQILYRMAEMLEGRQAQFKEELQLQGIEARIATKEIEASIDRLIYYAGWSDKFQQIFSTVNPVASSHFNFSVLEPTGVVTIFAPEKTSLLGLVSTLAPAIVGGNSVVLLASESLPLGAITFSEVLHTSDLPAGVVNILTGSRKELLSHMTSHMDVNAVVYCGEDEREIATLQNNATLNVKRVALHENFDWMSEESQSPYMILQNQEVKTTWHPIGI